MDTTNNDKPKILSEKPVQTVRHRVDRVLSSRIFLILPLVCIGLLGFAAKAKFTPKPLPEIPGYAWKDHPNVLLINYIDGGCGCLETLLPKIILARKLKYEIAIIKRPEDKIEDISIKDSRIFERSLIINTTTNLFSNTKVTSSIFIKSGRVADQSDLPELKAFFKDEIK
jgi:hypothetical protein